MVHLNCGMPYHLTLEAVSNFKAKLKAHLFRNPFYHSVFSLVSLLLILVLAFEIIVRLLLIVILVFLVFSVFNLVMRI